MTHYVIGRGGREDAKALRIDTRKRRHIDNETRLEKPLAGMLEVAKVIEDKYAETKLVSASAVYNCFGLAFAARRTWVSSAAEARKALADDGYRALPWDPRFWGIGDVVLYRTQSDDLCHVAVIVQHHPEPATGTFFVRVLSAWGESGEYIHPIDPGHPLLGKPFEVQSQRVR